jgi:radical SAM-linked protein
VTNNDAPIKIRVRFSKDGKVRYTSHRDLARIWERGLRRARVPVAYSEGFSPRPRISFGLALPTGYASDGEYLDITVSHPIDDLDGLIEPLSDALPDGIRVQALAPLPPRSVSLQEVVTSTTWLIEVVAIDEDELAAAGTAALARDEIVVSRDRKGKTVTDDLRPAIISMRVAGPGERGALLEAELATGRRSVRPAELVAALHDGWRIGAARRLYQWIETDDDRAEPLPLGATAGPHAQLRAS